MNKNAFTKIKFVAIAVVCVLAFTSFSIRPTEVERPRTITSSIKLEDGTYLRTTLISLDKHTTREEVIQTCVYLSHQNIQLTFDHLEMGRSLLGVVGRTRLRQVKGKIVLPNGSSQSFKAGGVFPFKTVRIQFSQQRGLDPTQIDMIEIVD